MARLGSSALAFYDAIAPVVSADSLDHQRLYALSRYGKGSGDDYLNAPMDAVAYEAFIDALLAADQFHGHDFDQVPYFEGCLPVEEMARRGRETLRFGPMKPVGLADPRTGREPHAVVQLRREDRAGQMWNLVGFQTRLRIPEQQRVFRMIPGLESPSTYALAAFTGTPTSIVRRAWGRPSTAPDDSTLFFAGQITGVEGYTESLGTGLLAGINLARQLQGMPVAVPPPTTMLGGLYRYLREADPKHFQPMNANFGLLDPLSGKVKKDRKKELLVERAQADLVAWMNKPTSPRSHKGATESHRATPLLPRKPGRHAGRSLSPWPRFIRGCL